MALTAPWRGAQNCRPSRPRGEEPETADPHGPVERRPALQTLTAPWRGAQNCRLSWPRGEEPKTADPHGPMERSPGPADPHGPVERSAGPADLLSPLPTVALSREGCGCPLCQYSIYMRVGYPRGKTLVSRQESMNWLFMATHSSMLAWEMPWTEETGGLQSMGS